MTLNKHQNVKFLFCFETQASFSLYGPAGVLLEKGQKVKKILNIESEPVIDSFWHLKITTSNHVTKLKLHGRITQTTVKFKITTTEQIIDITLNTPCYVIIPNTPCYLRVIQEITFFLFFMQLFYSSPKHSNIE